MLALTLKLLIYKYKLSRAHKSSILFVGVMNTENDFSRNGHTLFTVTEPMEINNWSYNLWFDQLLTIAIATAACLVLNVNNIKV